MNRLLAAQQTASNTFPSSAKHRSRFPEEVEQGYLGLGLGLQDVNLRVAQGMKPRL